MKSARNFDSVLIYLEIKNDEDPTKLPPRMDQEDEEEFEDLPSEADDIEDIFVYQNDTSRFIKHFM